MYALPSLSSRAVRPKRSINQISRNHLVRVVQAIFVIAALIWLIPDRRIEKRLAI
jgi:hypothetical protein